MESTKSVRQQLNFMFFSFMFIPKLIKDTIKLKQEQELTV